MGLLLTSEKRVAGDGGEGAASDAGVAGRDAHARILGALSAPSVVRVDEPLSKRTTLRVGGPADYYVEPADEGDLAGVLRVARELGVAVTVIGRGSNLLVRDGGIRGIVLCLSQPAFVRIEVRDCVVEAGAGVRLKALSAEARRRGLSGLEFLDGIPGSVGGALRMNAGAMGFATSEVVETVRVVDLAGRIRELAASGLDWAYRRCALFESQLALGAVFRGVVSTPEAVSRRLEGFNAKRWETQPKEPSAGCIFKNPTVAPAGRLVDEAGLKGRRVGAARVSEVHGNFIVNDGGATAAEVLELIEVMKAGVRSASGVELQTEVEILGEDRSCGS